MVAYMNHITMTDTPSAAASVEKMSKESSAEINEGVLCLGGLFRQPNMQSEADGSSSELPVPAHAPRLARLSVQLLEEVSSMFFN